ncbi:hypothetical protein D1007_28832 [Hordeum vulgare]|nr:hypothetical protein D1007_28832 [Hordeum vulgare]
MALRRSPRLHPQTPVSWDGAGATRRRSSRLNPQIPIGEEGAGVTTRGRSTRLHPQVHASEEVAGVTRHRRRRRGTSPASLPDDDDMLREILMRLPPQPSSLLRASAVCKRWLRVATDPRFLRSFSARHRKPPLLGVFEHDLYDVAFAPMLDPPDRIPPERFHIRQRFRKADLLGCRHGRVLLVDRWTFIVWDPIAGEQHRVDSPRAFDMSDYFYGSVLCPAADQGRMHCSSHSSPFNLVLMSPRQGYKEDDIIEFDLDRQSLAVIKGPPGFTYSTTHQIIQVEGDALGLAILSHGRIEMWQRKISCHGAVTWFLQKTIQIQTILALPPQVEGSIREVDILGSQIIFFDVKDSIKLIEGVIINVTMDTFPQTFLQFAFSTLTDSRKMLEHGNVINVG